MVSVAKVVRKKKAFKSDGVLTSAWIKFLEKTKEFENIPIANWVAKDFLGYILKKYSQMMGTDFPLSFSGSPSKCQEIYCINRMSSELCIPDKTLIKEYIDFVFDIFDSQKINITSFAIFYTKDFILKYKALIRKKISITRSTPLPLEFQKLSDSLGIFMETYGDLRMARDAVDENPSSEEHLPYQEFFSQIKNMYFDSSILDDI
jgi:hypothetical protein